MIDTEAITREDLIARLGAATGLLAGINASPGGTDWSSDETITAFLDSVWNPSKPAPIAAKVDEYRNV